VVLAEKPVISDTGSGLEPALLDVLLHNISTLSSVYHKPPEAFVSRTRVAVTRAEDIAKERAAAAAEEDAAAPEASSTGASEVPLDAAFLPLSVCASCLPTVRACRRGCLSVCYA
jgi:AP-1 complex subunit beta-1